MNAYGFILGLTGDTHSFVYFSNLGVLEYPVMCIEVTNDKYRVTQNFYAEEFDTDTI